MSEEKTPNDNSTSNSRENIRSFFSSSFSFLKDKAVIASEKAKQMIDRSKVIVTEMADEVQKTIQEELRGNDNMNENLKSDSYYCPWEDHDIPEAFQKEIEEQIRSISKSERHFINSPGLRENLYLSNGVVFKFDLNDWIGPARAVIAADKDLEQLRYALVPRHISEYSFWRTYFYKVSMIKLAYDLDYLPKKKIEKASIQKEDVTDKTHSEVHSECDVQISVDNEKVQVHEGHDNEFATDYYGIDDEGEWQNEFKEELSKLGISKGTSDQEKEWNNDFKEELDKLGVHENVDGEEAKGDLVEDLKKALDDN